MIESDKFQAAANFSRDWSGTGYEKGETQKFWTQLLRDVFEVDKPENFISPEKKVKIDGVTHFIDILILKTKVLIEQKSFGLDLNSAYEQAKIYAENLPYSERPRWIITCNFSEFQIYNLDCLDFPEKYRENYLLTHANDFNPPTDEDVENAIRQPTKILLKNLATDYKYLNFLVDPDIEMILPDVQISTAAAKIVRKLRDSLEKNYKKNSIQNYSAQIEKICTRLVFCFYANDANIFPQKIFDYIKNFPDDQRNSALQKLFEILNTPIELREKNLDNNLKNFPYVNGGLFEEKISLPTYNKFIENPINAALIFNAGKNFSWQTINPTIFGAMFESILNPETQRKGGMHFTGIDNIHKVIDPLFLDDLHEKFLSIKRKHKDKFLHLKNFQNEIASLKFFDPACGSGNFLTETYISLRRLENQILEEIKKILGELPENPVKVSIENFFGVEIYSFAVAVAKTALWIAENQMLQETKILTEKNLYELPLKKITNIHCANALTLDWNEILPDDLNFIIGNPPFVGRHYQTSAQKKEIAKFFTYKDIDYVACWFKKAAAFIRNKNIECAFVATNSITQGEQVAALWENLPVEINFAYRPFQWINESENMAAVHCVIISFANFSRKQKIIFDGKKIIPAKNINGYLQDAPNIYVKSRKQTLQKNIPPMFFGNMAADNKNFSLTEDEKNYFIRKYPESKNFIKSFIGGEEFLNGKKRFCFWLKGFSLDEIKKFPEIYERVEKVRKFRLNSTFKKIADRPHEFRDLKNPKNFLAVPQVSSENRKYIPIGFLDENFISTTQILIIPDANLFHFGILQSSVHMAWVRGVCGRLEMRYRYSKEIVYNNFIWCEYSEKIVQTAAKILEVRRKFEGWTMAKMYNEKTMPGELRAAHKENDRAVIEAYGFAENISEREILAEMMRMYKNLTEK